MTGAAVALALALAAALGPRLAAPLAQDWDAPAQDDAGDDEHVRRLFLSGWGGEAFDVNGGGSTSTVLGGEVAWAFEQLDLGVAGYGYRGLSDVRTWTPVGLLRLTQRFPMRSGLEATFGLGLGAARPSGWETWFQVALGVRYPLGPMFLGGELAFERGDLIRLSAGLGVGF